MRGLRLVSAREEKAIEEKEKAIEDLLKETRSQLVDLKESKRQTEDLLLEKMDSIALECKQKLTTFYISRRACARRAAAASFPVCCELHVPVR